MLVGAEAGKERAPGRRSKAVRKSCMVLWLRFVDEFWFDVDIEGDAGELQYYAEAQGYDSIVICNKSFSIGWRQKY